MSDSRPLPQLKILTRIATWWSGGVAPERLQVRRFSDDHANAERLIAEAREADRSAEFNFGSPHHNDLIIDRYRREADQKRLEARLILDFWEARNFRPMPPDTGQRTTWGAGA